MHETVPMHAGHGAGRHEARVQLEDVARHYGSALRAYFRRRGIDTSQSDDLSQEVFFRLARRATLGTNLGAIPWIRRYLYRTAATVLADHFRSEASHGAGLNDFYEEDLHAPEDFSPERVLLGQEALRTAREVIRAMPERTRQAFVLYRFQKLRQAEIAGRMGITVSAVEKLIRQGMIRLAAGMDDAE